MRQVLVTVAFVAGLLVAGLLVAGPPASAGTSSTLVVVGDSISDPALYNDIKTSARRAWWSRLASKTRLAPVVHAESGSGYGKGGRCTGTNFEERINLPQVRRAIERARIVVIEGGINDYMRCQYDDAGTFTVTRLATQDEIDLSVRRTLRTLDRIVRDDRKVYVTVPWGPRESLAQYRVPIVRSVKGAARRYGFRYLSTADGTLNEATTRDGVHPNSAGNLAIYQRLYYHSDMGERAG